MRECLEAEGLIVRSVDGELSAVLERRLAAHMRTCAACRESWEAQAAVRSLLSGRGLTPLPTGFAARARARRVDLGGWLDIANWRWWSWRLLPVAGCLVALAAADRLTTEGSPQLELNTVMRQWAESAGSDLASPIGADRLFAEADVDRDDLLVDALVADRQAAEDVPDER